MIASRFDNVARRAARTSRRGSLLALGSAGLGLAGLGAARPMAAKRKKKGPSRKAIRRRIERLSNKECRREAEECATVSAQKGAPQTFIACCALLNDCNYPAFAACAFP